MTEQADGTSLAGEPADVAVPKLVDRYGPRLHAIARHLCANPADAEDLVQEVFHTAYRRWDTFRGDADPSSWLYTIAARACKPRHMRKGGTDRRVPAFSQLLPWSEDRVMDLPGAVSDPLTSVIDSEARDALHAAIVALPDHFRVPLVLKEMLELPIEEVAEALDLKPATVKTRLHRARLLLRKALMARVPKVQAPDPAYDRQVCLDLLRAKLEAMDRGRGFPIGQDVVCDRCRAVFRELDTVQDVCAHLAEGELPEGLREAVLARLRAEGRSGGD